MTIKKPVLDYRKVRIQNIIKGEFEHLKLLLFWPVFGILFYFCERIYPVKEYYSVHCFIDDMIPFCEWFLIPYLFWFVYMVGMLLYGMLYDVDAYCKAMWYIIITYTSALIVYLVFPTCQDLRPLAFERDNILTRFMAWYYDFDTNTNVLPSMHVMGSLAVMEAALWVETIRSKWVKFAFVITAVLICISTVFVKQHSALDIFAALPICLIAHFLCRNIRKKSHETSSEKELAIK